MSYRFLEYELPKERIAQQPAVRSGERSDARLLYALRQDATGGLRISDRWVRDLPELLRAGDLLVLNDSRVRPARFFIKLPGSDTEAEVLLLDRCGAAAGDGSGAWEALARPMRRFKEGLQLPLSAHIAATVLGRSDDDSKLRLHLAPSSLDEAKTLDTLIESEGSMPIPGYIRDGVADREDSDFYQTVFARELGSVAAPTAGLHFTLPLLQALSDRGVEHEFLTLHVGLASFAPVRDVDSHQMTNERYHISSRCLDAINRTKARVGRVVVVGTTATRALESAALAEPALFSGEQIATDGVGGRTELMIRPGFKFQVVDLLMTNFHQPLTTHLLLVAAFIGEQDIEQIYQHALQGAYRFLSYGDSMLLERRE